VLIVIYNSLDVNFLFTSNLRTFPPMKSVHVSLSSVKNHDKRTSLCVLVEATMSEQSHGPLSYVIDFS